MQIIILSIGKTKDSSYERLEQEYLKRLRGRFQCTLNYVKNTKELLQTLEKSAGELVLLSEQGSVMNSREFAQHIDTLARRTNAVTFVVGDAAGFPEEIRQYEADMLALSEMTFPHEMARVILLEQLYRAQTILDGHPYHK
jgi:23S rRNA (pseudouridine1915-N3)-methyltransferase